MEGARNRKYSEVSLELRGSRSLKNAEGIQGQSWKDSKMFLEQKTGRPLTLRGSRTESVRGGQSWVRGVILESDEEGLSWRS